VPIRVLPAQVAARIAAGEVVERPASIVKELVENALDAGATRIRVEITGAGVDSIRVVDDGCGIAAEELATAFERHATSKLEGGEDLSRILTLGFRGEALPSIAAAGEVEAVSRPHDRDSAAAIHLGPDLEPSQEPRGAPVGTSFTVRGLFARQPARRKFLKSPASETSAISSVVTAYALAYPEIRFALKVDGRETLSTAGTGDLRDAVSAVYGADVASQMIAVSEDDGVVGVEGLAGPPHISRAGRGYVTLFVNRRWIQNRRLAFAVEQAYEGLLMVGRRPLAVLNLKVPYEEVDVNVHPTKAEVRFRDESLVFGALQKAVRRALLASAPAPVVGSDRPLVLSGQPSAPLLWQHGVAVEERKATAGTAPALDEPRPAMAQTLPALRVIGQFGAVYIIAEGPEGMYLIDQHAAHERVLYDRFVAARASKAPDVQGLLDPVAVELSPRQMGLVATEAEAMRSHGFEIETFGDGGECMLRAIPSALAGSDPRDGLVRFLDLMLDEGEADGRDRVAMTLACHGAVRAGKTLTAEEMRDLVRQLEQTASPNTCPHGRPTMVHMSAELLAREFGRR
jgi:DNA mismatch repair protein MutL